MSDVFEERRKCPRYRCRNNLVRLDWWHEGEAAKAYARLFDISRGGVSVALGPMMLTSGTVWVSLEEPTPTLWFKVEVVWQDVSNRVGLALTNKNPLDIFHAATLAIGFTELFGP